ncbi:hypothetical protein FKM82_002201 [Ascaphus truei]
MHVPIYLFSLNDGSMQLLWMQEPACCCSSVNPQKAKDASCTRDPQKTKRLKWGKKTEQRPKAPKVKNPGLTWKKKCNDARLKQEADPPG